MNRLLLSVLSLTDRPTSYLTRPPAAPRAGHREYPSSNRRSLAARTGRLTMGAGMASALLIGSAREGTAADIGAVLPPSTITLVDSRPAVVTAVASKIYTPTPQLTGTDYVDITSIGVSTNSTAPSLGSATNDMRPSGGVSQVTSFHAWNAAPSVVTVLSVFDNKQSNSIPLASEHSDAPDTTTAPPLPAKSDADNKAGRTIAQEGNSDSMPVPSKLLGALLACALILRRPKRHLRA